MRFLKGHTTGEEEEQTTHHGEKSKSVSFLHPSLTPPENDGRQKDHEAEGT
jgi:hypothetical protein